MTRVLDLLPSLTPVLSIPVRALACICLSPNESAEVSSGTHNMFSLAYHSSIVRSIFEPRCLRNTLEVLLQTQKLSLCLQ